MDFASKNPSREESQNSSLKLQQFANEIIYLKQQNQEKDEKIKLYEMEIAQLQAEKASLSQQLARYEKNSNGQRLTSYSKTTNELYDKFTNANTDFFSNTSNNNSSLVNESIDEKPKKTFYNGIYFKKPKDSMFPKEEVLKSIESKPSRKNSNNIFDLPLNEKTTSLFENFLMISCTRNNFENFTIESNDKEIFLPPSVIFQYPTLENQNIKKTIENYIFPIGVKAQNLNLDESFSHLNQIIFKSNNIVDQRNNCFTMVIKTDESYTKISQHHKQSLYESIRNFLSNFPSNSKDSADAFVKLNQLDFLEMSNPNNFLYIYGIRTSDFIESKEQRNRLPKKKRFWGIEKAFCFVTKYPLTQFFYEAVLQILNVLKITKMKLQMEENSESFSKLDIDFVKNFFSNDLIKILSLLNEKTKNLTFDFLINFKDPKIPFELQYQLPDINKCFYTEIDWDSSLGLSNLTDEAFAFIFFSLLLENPIVFVSENLGLLTSTMMLFLNLIQPFKWHYPLIFNVPQDLMQILESPFPIFVGINKNNFFVPKLSQKYLNIMFICLDKNIKIYNQNIVKGCLDEEMYHKLRTIFKEFFEKFEKKKFVEHDLLGISSDFPVFSKHLVPNPNEEQKKYCQSLFKNLDNYLYLNFIKLIPEKPLYAIGEKNLLNYEMIRAQIKNKDRQNVFLAKFIQTQMFTFFLDEFYTKV